MEFTERMERGRDAAAALRHRGIMTGKCAAGWNRKKRHDDEGTWHAVYADARKRWQYAKTDSQSLYERMVFPERDFDPFDPHAPDPAGLAKKLASEPMRANKPQAACDVGLFSDASQQIDLEDLLR